MSSLNELPDNLPVPEDDGACDHLPGAKLPDIALTATDGGMVNLSRRPGTTVVYCYPMTGRPGVPLPEGWDDIPGARGCTPQSCSFRDHHAELSQLGAAVFGLSAQDTDYQREMAERLHLPFAVLSDSGFGFCDAMGIPTFEAGGMRLIRRVTMIVRDGAVEAFHYPVFPSDSDPEWVLARLAAPAGGPA